MRRSARSVRDALPVRKGLPLLAVVCAVLFAALAVAMGVRHGSPLPGDGAAHVWALRHRPPVGLALARGITATGTGPWPYLIVVAAGLVAGRDTGERVRAVVYGLAVLVAGQLVRSGLMELFARARPNAADWATHASGFAFPSGHTTTSALTAGFVCWAVTRHIRPGPARTRCVIAVCWAVAVGLSRVYLGVHWASDVLGGWLLAGAWLGLCWWALGRWPGVRMTGGGASGRSVPGARGRAGAGARPDGRGVTAGPGGRADGDGDDTGRGRAPRPPTAADRPPDRPPGSPPPSDSAPPSGS
ncbi:phosphatase PAP2 family protein [Streptomyces sp. NPDC002144]|uniref:phosphatase PAP2 family protein n=1 Tax=Streptomyces sp. NPDC006668 TaxID=3156903 RepID=UPI0033DE7691